MLSKNAVKYIQSLQQKKYREQYGLFVAEGPKVVGELIREKAFACKAVYALEEWEDDAVPASAEKTVVSASELERISGLQTPNRVLAVFEMRAPVKPSADNCFSVVLDGIQDPGNAGTIIRTADWFGVSNIICSELTADMYNPKVVQSSMASLARVNIYYTDPAAWLKEQNDVKVIAAGLAGKDLRSVEKSGSAILIIGNESAGVSHELMQMADECVRIPGKGGAESLNAGVAAGILMYSLLT